MYLHLEYIILYHQCFAVVVIPIAILVHVYLFVGVYVSVYMSIGVILKNVWCTIVTCVFVT